jgi:D-beta-D-heptose 7-phosphate kinase/D-beta-D-heptose 1-phosphate adenosyltransferase
MIEQLRKARVQVWGDGILDVYHYGRSDRICPEAPVPVFVETSRDSRAGGAANVVRNLDSLGCKTISTLSEFCDWSEKHRYLVSGHQLLRVDADKMSKPGRAELRKDVDCLVISDYAKGWCGFDECRWIINEAIERGIPVVVDPKGTDWAKYKGCTVICPNELEAKTMTGIHGQFMPKFPAVLYKLGAKGMWLDQEGKESIKIEAQDKQVYDVTGAGDTVVAVLAAMLAIGKSLEDAAVLANVAAGYVVGQPGTATCPVQILVAAEEIDDTLLACYTAP